jgi:hypothetical protein
LFSKAKFRFDSGEPSGVIFMLGGINAAGQSVSILRTLERDRFVSCLSHIPLQATTMDDLAADAPAPASIPDVYSRFRLGLFRIRQALNWCIHTRLARLAAYALIQIGSFVNAVGIRPSGLKIIFFARRIAPLPSGDRAIRKVMEEDAVDRDPLDRLLGNPHPRSLLACAPRILILKVPCLQNGQVVEKGALIIKFTETFAPFFLGIDTNQLADHFWIILEPSRVGYSVPELVLWTRLDKSYCIDALSTRPSAARSDVFESGAVAARSG